MGCAELRFADRELRARLPRHHSVWHHPGEVVVGISPVNQIVWPLAYLLFAWLTLRRWPDVLNAAIRTWWVLLMPMLAVVSVLWSLDPVTSANAALRLGVSALIGLYIGAAFGLGEIARAVFWVLMATVGLSVLVALLGLDFAIMFDGKARGIFYHKNQLGDRATILVAASLAFGVIERRPWFGLVGVLLASVALALARSATSLVSVVAVVAMASLLIALRGRALAVAFRGALIGAAATVLGTLVVLSGIDLVAAILEFLDRDPTLTGRSFLWEAAWAQIEHRPLLGTGYEAFWAVAVDWRTLQVLERMGQVGHFHNTFLEVGVQLGRPASSARLSPWSPSCGAGSMSFRLDSPVGIWSIAFATAVIALALAEYELFAKHSFDEILMVATAVAGVRTLDGIRQASPGDPTSSR